jgi:hypothetical protein
MAAACPVLPRQKPLPRRRVQPSPRPLGWSRRAGDAWDTDAAQPMRWVGATFHEKPRRLPAHAMPVTAAPLAGDLAQACAVQSSHGRTVDAGTPSTSPVPGLGCEEVRPTEIKPGQIREPASVASGGYVCSGPGGRAQTPPPRPPRTRFRMKITSAMMTRMTRMVHNIVRLPPVAGCGAVGFRPAAPTQEIPRQVDAETSMVRLAPATGRPWRATSRAQRPPRRPRTRWPCRRRRNNHRPGGRLGGGFVSLGWCLADSREQRDWNHQHDNRRNDNICSPLEAHKLRCAQTLLDVQHATRRAGVKLPKFSVLPTRVLVRANICGCARDSGRC